MTAAISRSGARRGDRLRALAERPADQHGVTVQTRVADLADPGDLAELAGMAAAAEPDLLVNNAGFAGYREFCDVGPTVVSDLIAVHVMALARLARAAIPAMVARGSGGDHQRGIRSGLQRLRASAATAVVSCPDRVVLERV